MKKILFFVTVLFCSPIVKGQYPCGNNQMLASEFYSFALNDPSLLIHDPPLNPHLTDSALGIDHRSSFETRVLYNAIRCALENGTQLTIDGPHSNKDFWTVEEIYLEGQPDLEYLLEIKVWNGNSYPIDQQQIDNILASTIPVFPGANIIIDSRILLTLEYMLMRPFSVKLMELLIPPTHYQEAMVLMDMFLYTR